MCGEEERNHDMGSESSNKERTRNDGWNQRTECLRRNDKQKTGTTPFRHALNYVKEKKK